MATVVRIETLESGVCFIILNGYRAGFALDDEGADLLKAWLENAAEEVEFMRVEK